MQIIPKMQYFIIVKDEPSIIILKFKITQCLKYRIKEQNSVYIYVIITITIITYSSPT